MPTQCNQEFLKFHPLEKREVRGGFDGGAITSDAGGLLLREVEKRTGIIRQFAACFQDHRQAERIEHGVEELVEAPKHREGSFCCGAGGGMMFLGDEKGERVNTTRAKELVATEATTVGTACPFCQSMFKDALKSVSQDPPKLLDIAQILSARL